MKYYIPLSSLNVDNVLSSESISPISFYKARDFGYRTFEQLSEISLMNDILLVSELPSFSIQDSDRENYPAILEIEDDLQLKNKLREVKKSNKNPNLFLCDSTIYLTPWNCKVLFYSGKAKAFTRLTCEDSLCNKLGHLFSFDVIKPGKFNLVDILNLVKIKESSWEFNKILPDKNINRIKGILYGFYLGYSKSTSPDVATLIGIQRKIYNIVATIINNKGEMNSQFITKLIDLEKSYNLYDPRIKQLKRLWDEKILSRFSSDNDRQAFEQILYDLSIESESKLKFCRKYGITTRNYKVSNSKPITDWGAYQNELSIYTRSIIHEDKSERPDFFFNELMKLKDNYSNISFTGADDQRFNSILSKFFFSQVTSIEDIRLNKFEVATDYTKGIKSLMLSNNRKWEDSPESKYYNSLRINIKASEPFNLKNAPSIIDLSIAAFLLKGEDFGALLHYLEENGVHDYKYVLSFWGAASGYIDMPKTILKSITTSVDAFCEKYKQINRLLFNTVIKTSFPNIREEHLNIKTRTPSVVQEPRENSKDVNKDDLLIAVEFIRKQLPKFNKQQNIAIGDSLTEASNSNKFLATLKTHKGCGTTSKVYKAFKAYFEKSMYVQSSNGSLFSSSTTTKYGIISELLCFKNTSAEILERLQDNWDFVVKREKDRTDRISFFINLCKKEGEGRSNKITVLKDFFTLQIAENCKKELEKKYDR
jgi:hypothetical protein